MSEDEWEDIEPVCGVCGWPTNGLRTVLHAVLKRHRWVVSYHIGPVKLTVSKAREKEAP